MPLYLKKTEDPDGPHVWNCPGRDVIGISGDFPGEKGSEVGLSLVEMLGGCDLDRQVSRGR